MTTLKIAKEKERFLENSIRVLEMESETKHAVQAEDIEYIAQDAIGLFHLLIRCDEYHQLTATISDDYPYQAVEETLEHLFIKFLELCNQILYYVEDQTEKGYKIKDQEKLEAVRAKAKRIVEDDEEFYESEDYRSITANAMEEYQKGQVEKWPK